MRPDPTAYESHLKSPAWKATRKRFLDTRKGNGYAYKSLGRHP